MVNNKVFYPCRALGFVSNHVPLQVRYIKSRKENLIVTCVGKSFHTYAITHFSLLSVSAMHSSDILCMGADSFHVYTGAGCNIYAWRRGTELKHCYKGHQFNVNLLLPFGIHLISIDEGNQFIVWDIKEETKFLELNFNKDDFRITSIIHPSTYINKILLGSEQGQLQLWNINTSKLIYTFKGWRSAVTALAQTPALDVVAIGLQNGKIYIHNIKCDETIMDLLQDWGAITSISFRWDGEPIMATGSVCGNIVFWDLEKRQVASQLLGAHGSSVTGMVCLPNEPLILTSSPDNTLKLWIFDMPDGGARLLRVREGHSSAPSFIRFHGSNGHNILSAASDSSLRIFNTRTEQFNKSLGRASYNRKASKKRKAGSNDPLIMPPIIQFTSETTREKEWDNIASLHSGLTMVTTWSYDKLKMGDLKLLPERFHKKNLKGVSNVVATCLSMTRCGNFVIVGYSTGHVDRFNMQSGIWRDCYGAPEVYNGPIRGVAVDGLNQIVITGDSHGHIHFWRFKSKGSASLKLIDLEDSINFFRNHYESSMLAVALEDFSTCIIDIDTKRVIRKFSGHVGQVTDATFSPDCRWLITSSMDSSIKIWDIPSGQLINHFATEEPCISLDLSPNGETLATAHVDYLGIFLWTNSTLFSRITLKAIDPSEEAPLIALPECSYIETVEEEICLEADDSDFKSPEQISNELITLSGLPTSRWLNLLNIDIIKKRNKPKAPPKAPKLAPFFLPTIPSLSFQFDLSNENVTNSGGKTLAISNFTNYSAFSRLVDMTFETNDFSAVIDKLKSFGPSMIDFEIKSLSPESGGGSVQIMLQFLKCLEYMLMSNKDFELAISYLGVFIKAHGAIISKNEELRRYLPNIQSCHSVAWNRLQDKLLFSLSIVENFRIS
ncbi:hypothetical protein WA026_018150 [Henosepilachna vigintioctopunctata]|uniref:WD repeat-containing protein 36 n=1 Tax=Henosepilachna vigintioctopunctata TaxID=420089 RepID=A0AAW1UN72_9CUCU